MNLTKVSSLPYKHRDNPGTARHYYPRSGAEWEGRCNERSAVEATES